MSGFEELTDEQIVLIVQTTGESNAFNQLVKRHAVALQAFLTRYTAERTLAEDLAQETFIKSYQKLNSFAGNSSFKTWLFRIAYRELLQHKRRQKVWHKVLHLFSEEKQHLHHQAESDSGSTRLDLDLALQELETNERAAVLLCDYFGMSHSEAAATMDAPLGSLKTYVQRGRQKLRERLDSTGVNDGTE